MSQLVKALPGGAHTRLSRRRLLQGSAAVAAAGLATPYLARRAMAADPVEIVHWSWLAASDGEVWAKMIDDFNAAHEDKGMTRSAWS